MMAAKQQQQLLVAAVRLLSRRTYSSTVQQGASNPQQTLNEAPKWTKSEHEMLSSMLRVDHAGEIGADKIYEGQMFILGHTETGPLIQKMWDQEKHHRAVFDKLVNEYRVRPTLLHPVWEAAGFALGAGTALLGKEAAMACTEAVETVIGEHYNDQLRDLISLNDDRFKPLKETIRQFRDEELEHLETAVEHDAKKAPGYIALNNVIQSGCRVAIWIASRV